MADRAATRKKQKREKKRLKDRQRSEAARKKRRASLVKSPMKLTGLPLSDCYISEHWHEHGPTVVVCVSRQHPNQRIAAAMFTIDLAEKGVISAELIRDMPLEQLPASLSQRGENSAVVECAAPLAAKVIAAGVAMGKDSGHNPPRSFAEASVLLRGIDPEDCPHEIFTGSPPEETVAKEKPGLLAGLKKRLGLSS